MNTETLQKFTAVVTVLLIVVSGMPLSPVGTASAAPSGMVGLPDSNVVVDVPAGSDVPDEAAWQGDVMATDYASSLEVTITTADRAESLTNGTTVGTGDDVALVLRDDVHHQGRRVALPRAAVNNTLGYVPERVYGMHESGEEWSRSVKRQGNFVIFEVPHFSTNTVTFEGEVTISDTPASNGTSHTYTISDGGLDAASDVSINLTGTVNSERDTESAAAVADGGTVSVSVAGDLAPKNETVTFSGVKSSQSRTVSVTGVSDGSTKSYSIDGNLAPTGESVTFTGETTTKSGSASGTGNGSISVGGNLAPSSESMTVTGVQKTLNDGKSGEFDSVTLKSSATVETVVTINFTVTDDGDQYSEPWEVTWDNGSATGSVGDGTYGNVPGGGSLNVSWTVSIEPGSKLDFYVSNSSGAVNLASVEATVDGKAISGTVSGQSVDWGVVTAGETATKSVSLSSGSNSITLSDPTDWSASWTARTATEDPSVDLDGDGTPEASVSGILTEGQTATVSSFDVPRGSHTATTNTNAGSTVSWDFSFDETYTTDSPSIDVDGDGTAEASYSGVILPSESQTVAIDGGLSLSTSSINVSATRGPVDVTVGYTERTGTADPGVEVNGVSNSTTATLADGETTQLTINKSALQEGTNTVNITVGDGSLSSDAPAPQVNVEYSHDAVDKRSATYQAESFSERYNVSKQFASSRTDAALVIDHVGSIYAMRDVEYRINESGGWSEVSDSRYTFSGSDSSTLTVDLDAVYGGEIPAGTTFEIRSNASKVNPHNASISVSAPSKVGERTNVTVSLTEWNSDSYLGVTLASQGSMIHYASEETWSGPQDYAKFDSQGRQRVFMPNASSGHSARIKTIPVEVAPSSGEVLVSVPNDANATPPFTMEIEPGTVYGDTVFYTYPDAGDGTDWVLQDITHGRTIDSAEANSPVTLEGDDDSRTIELREESSGGSTSDGDGGSGTGGVGPEGRTAPDEIPTGALVTLGAGVGGLLALVWLYRRLGWPIRQEEGRLPLNPLFALPAGLLAVIVFDITSGGQLSAAVGFGVRAAAPLGATLGVLLAAYYVYRRFILAPGGGGA
ncbi:hypothetical protein [Halobaculum sp. EA56]|uniref:hypothetical protein n=1 Tax=Halobaculum sp. EA56 TaxID=3421648 RepID=UPI003EBC84DA